MTQQQDSRDVSIDLLRAVLVVYVVFYLHLGGYIGDGQRHVTWVTPILTNVVLGMFTFLSGYLLARSPGVFSWPSVARFYRRRLLRIYPLYVPALIGFVGLWLCSPFTGLKAVLGLSMFWPDAPETLWYVPMILACYAFAPALLFLRSRLCLAFACALWLAMLAWQDLSPLGLDVRMLTQFPAFVAGMLWRRHDLRSALGTRVWILAALFGLAVLGAMTSVNPQLQGAVTVIPAVLLGPPLLLALADRWGGVWARSPAVARLSQLSFAAYLYHRIVYQSIERWVLRPGTTELAHLALLLGLGIPLVLLVASLAQGACDRLLSALRL